MFPCHWLGQWYFLNHQQTSSQIQILIVDDGSTLKVFEAVRYLSDLRKDTGRASGTGK